MSTAPGVPRVNDYTEGFPVLKYCGKCRRFKSRCAFSKRRASKDGLQTECRDCNAATSAAWRAENRERRAAWYAANRGRYAATSAAWYAANRERRAAYNAAWRAENRERRAAYNAAWLAANPDKHRAQARRRRARARANGVIPYREADVWAACNHACIACGAPGEHLDHWQAIANGGPDAITNATILCAACNLSKGTRDPLEFLGSRGIRFDRVIAMGAC